MNPVTVSITGAAGQIGYAMLYRIASGAMLGPQTPINLRLIELPGAMSALQGVLMELQDCAFPLLNDVVCTSDLDEGFEGANWALLVGAMPRKAGMERSDLLAKNASIFKEQGAAINRSADDNIKTLVVGNPCNTNAMICAHFAPRINRSQFFAMTMLDENRAKAQLAIKAGVPVSAVDNMIIWGNHSATQCPAFDAAKIKGQSAREYINDDQWMVSTFMPMVQQRGAQVIKARGQSSAGSAANAAIETVSRIEGFKPDQWFSVATYAKGDMDIDQDIWVSMPVKYQDGALIKAKQRPQLDVVSEQYQVSIKELLAERQVVESLGLLA